MSNLIILRWAVEQRVNFCFCFKVVILICLFFPRGNFQTLPTCLFKSFLWNENQSFKFLFCRLLRVGENQRQKFFSSVLWKDGSLPMISRSVELTQCSQAGATAPWPRRPPRGPRRPLLCRFPSEERGGAVTSRVQLVLSSLLPWC